MKVVVYPVDGFRLVKSKVNAGNISISPVIEGVTQEINCVKNLAFCYATYLVGVNNM
jgi:hypothetical protein